MSNKIEYGYGVVSKDAMLRSGEFYFITKAHALAAYHCDLINRSKKDKSWYRVVRVKIEKGVDAEANIESSSTDKGEA